MRIAGLVIIYYPGKDVLKNIDTYINCLEKLYVIDNTDHPFIEFKKKIEENKKIIYLHDGKNNGIAARLNQVSKLAIDEGYDWLLTMDQDSYFEKGVCDNYFNCFSLFGKKEKVSQFGITFSEKNSENIFCNSEIVHELITSGSLLNLSLLPTIGFFDEELFIDEVDFEYCLRSMQHGFQVIRFTNIFLNHSLGELSQHRSFKTNKITSRTLHSPIRLYYMTRNFLYVQSKYRSLFSNDIAIKRRSILNRFKNNILYNKEKLLIIKYIIQGYTDYKRKKMGKYS